MACFGRGLRSQCTSSVTIQQRSYFTEAKNVAEDAGAAIVRKELKPTFIKTILAAMSFPVGMPTLLTPL